MRRAGFNFEALGIPFAQPPLGNLRLRPPVLQTRLDVSIFNATSFGPGCLQLVRRFMVSSQLLRVECA